MTSLQRFLCALRRDDRGQELLEMVLVAPLLIIVLFGVIEFGNAYHISQTMAGLSRESANIASRGTEMTEALNVALTNGNDIDLGTNGGVVVTEITIQGGAPVVTAQVASGGHSSQIGSQGSPASGLGGLAIVEGRAFYAVEIFYDYDPITPLGGIHGGTVVLPQNLYDVSIF